MATFAKGSLSAGVHAKNRVRLERLSGQEQTVDGKVTWIVDPTDATALRGIPAVGPGCAGGAISGTRPGTNL